ncbi:Galactinol synthase 2 [Camellia lanceoleosa]|uniref:Galactinol synthase 2 n=1 Tax=Camellia lanceoleosa TaxID=1840588 RepID=A0ACC0ILH4_9ERIC|nr:Galactinol synthase 2 [Camellia lanceoleosa]
MAPELVSATTKATSLVKAASLMSRAYVTFLAGNGDYVKGVVGLAKGLRKVHTAYPLVVAVLPDVPKEHRRMLVAQGCIVREIVPVYPQENQTQFAMAYYVINYSKLRIWEVFENIDHLFDNPNGYFYAVKDCFCEKTWSHTPQYQIGYCQQCPDKVHWPAELGPKPPLYFNAGMFVFEPSLSIYDDLLQTLKITPPTPFAEQGSKPWRYTGKEENMDRKDINMLVKSWWDIYNDESLDYKRTNISPIEGEADKVIVSMVSEANAGHYTPAPPAA